MLQISDTYKEQLLVKPIELWPTRWKFWPTL